MATVVLLSGGLDSTTLLYHLRAEGHEVIPVGFHYGQRHARELESARAICEGLGLPYRVFTMPDVQAVKPEIPDGHYAEESMKATVWPNRNMVMLAIAVGFAVDRHHETVAYAAHGGDHAIYPDCRPDFVGHLRAAIKAGNWYQVDLFAPFVNLTKADIVARGATLGVPFGVTWSCYRGGLAHCGTCGTCYERREAFREARIADPTEYA